MGRFVFRFEAVARVKKLKEQEALRRLGETQRELEAELQARARMSHDLARSLERREEAGGSDKSLVAIEELFIQGQKQRIHRQEAAIFRARKKTDKAMKFYLERKRETEILEKLRERDMALHRQQENKLEQKRADEGTLMRHRLKEGEWSLQEEGQE